jgi:hypothetical protein
MNVKFLKTLFLHIIIIFIISVIMRLQKIVEYGDLFI